MLIRPIGPIVLLLTALVMTSNARASTGDPRLEKALYHAIGEPVRQVGDQHVRALVQRIVSAAGSLSQESGSLLLPPGTVVDRADWNGALLEIDLTLVGAAKDWRLSPTDMGAINHAFAMPFMVDTSLAGVKIRARRGPHDPYNSLAQFVPVAPVPPEWPAQDTEIPEAHDQPVKEPRADLSLGGSTSAARQPAGALSGVVVYVSAGHGWMAGSTVWALQRPLVHEMNEDYGNIDQLNYFVHFAHNAGATVVPLRPAGWQPIEIVLDNDDPGVSYTGTWTDSSGTKYFENGVTLSGVPYRFSTAVGTGDATARFTPTIATTDYYPVYCFTIAGSNRVRQTYRVSHSGGITEITVDHREVGNGWVWLGEFFLESGADNYVEITNESPDSGIVVAEAIRFGCGMGDVSRPGPGTTSGYSRDEEGQRYWGESQLGDNAVNFSSSIWDLSGVTDGGDNVGAGARIAREMNQVPAGGVQADRWKRVHLEFHSNAASGSARGQLCLISDSGSTTNQTAFATTLSNEIDADLLLVDSGFEHSWIDRSSATLTGGYGAISTSNNSDEFDATLVELAFHDNQQDAELLRDPSVRRAMARACVQGIVRFLSTLSGSQVPLAFSPDTPRQACVEDLGGGDVLISWVTPLVDGARGDAATGYVVYQSSNGFGFGDPIVLGNVTSTTVSGLAVGETRYFRVAATNAGGESMPTEVLAVRRPDSGTATVLIVNGFDRLQRMMNPRQTFAQPPAYAGLSIERQQWRRSNAFNYVVEHADALAANNVGFASTSNEAVASQLIDLNAYDVAVWILGSEHVDDATFDTTEQARVDDFLTNGGALFVSGSNIAYDLISQGGGVTFAQNALHIGFSNDDAATVQATGVAGGVLSDIATFDFDVANGAPYEVFSPDRLLEGTNAAVCLNYVGGLGGIAGLQYNGATHNVVTFGFPFETISNSTARADIMQRVLDFLVNAELLQFDFNDDGYVDSTDFNAFGFCFLGPDFTFSGSHMCLEGDADSDADVDLRDFAEMQIVFTGS